MEHNIREHMQNAMEKDVQGDEYHQDPEDDCWQKNACVCGVHYAELPGAYVRLLEHYDWDFEKFLEAHKGYDTERKKASSEVINGGTRSTAHRIQTALNAKNL